VFGGGRSLTASGLNVTDLVLDAALLQSVGGTLTRFDDVTFQNFGANARLFIAHPGQAAPAILRNVDFGVVGGVEGLLVVNDSAPTDELRLQLTLTGASPANGCPFVFESGGALVTWNGTPCQ
jgi:hypothetical protein